jgi:hypothetical protein
MIRLTSFILALSFTLGLIIIDKVIIDDVISLQAVMGVLLTFILSYRSSKVLLSKYINN